MEKKIDIAKILKDCPRGMELDCTIYDDVTLDSVVFESEYHYENTNNYPIKIVTKSGFSTRLTKYGQNVDIAEAKCMIFPKGKTTWEGFHRPFKDGDILYVDANDNGDDDDRYKYVFIFEEMVGQKKEEIYGCKVMAHCYTTVNGHFKPRKVYLVDSTYPIRFATEEEKKKLFDAIKDNGYKWNDETKTLEELIVPKFKVGDTVRRIGDYISGVVVDFDKDYFYKIEYNSGCVSYVNINAQDDWELFPTRKFKVGDRIRSKTTGWEFIIVEIKDDSKVIVKSPNNTLTKYPNTFSYFNFCDTSDFELAPNKFDTNTLIPFESKVLVRDKNTDEWRGHFFSHYDNKSDRPYICIGVEGINEYKQCIPYNDNEHLLGTTNDCDEYYRVWEE